VVFLAIVSATNVVDLTLKVTRLCLFQELTPENPTKLGRYARRFTAEIDGVVRGTGCSGSSQGEFGRISVQAKGEIINT
jgi:hypothetical protein